MITPYLPTLNLSVDNAMSLSQIVHQLITQLNNITKYVNEMDLGVDEKISTELKSYDERLQVQLEALQETLANAISEASADCKNYTDLKSDAIYSTIETLETELKLYVDKYNEIQDKEIEVLKLEMESLRITLDEINKTQGSAVSPLTGESKSLEDCIYDCNQQSLKTASYTIQQMLELIYSDAEILNRMGETIPLITTVEQFLSNSLGNSPKTYFGNDLVYLQQGSTTIDSLTSSSKGYIANCYKWAENRSNGHRSKVLFTEIISDITGLEDEVFQGTWLFFNPVSCINKTFFKDENIRNDYLMKARDMGLLNTDNTIKESGEYPL